MPFRVYDFNQTLNRYNIVMSSIKTNFSWQEINHAYHWLCKQRKDYPANADIWHLRFHRADLSLALYRQLNNQTYSLSPLQKLKLKSGETIHLWNATDALVLKLLSNKLLQRLPLSKSCTHIKGHGGHKYSIRKLQDNLPHHKFVIRTDVKQYYASINHYLLMNKLATYIRCPYLLCLLWQYLQRTVESGGQFKTITSGICRGSALSPVIGAFFLTELDQHFVQQKSLFYLRYMDDIIILAKTRWKLRKAIAQCNRLLEQHQLSKAREKTFIGRIETGFDFLGYHHDRQGLTLANKTLLNFFKKLTLLYEQKPPLLDIKKAPANEFHQQSAVYLRVSNYPLHNPLVKVGFRRT